MCRAVGPRRPACRAAPTRMHPKNDALLHRSQRLLFAPQAGKSRDDGRPPTNAARTRPGRFARRGRGGGRVRRKDGTPISRCLGRCLDGDRCQRLGLQWQGWILRDLRRVRTHLLDHNGRWQTGHDVFDLSRGPSTRGPGTRCTRRTGSVCGRRLVRSSYGARSGQCGRLPHARRRARAPRRPQSSAPRRAPSRIRRGSTRGRDGSNRESIRRCRWAPNKRPSQPTPIARGDRHRECRGGLRSGDVRSARSPMAVAPCGRCRGCTHHDSPGARRDATRHAGVARPWVDLSKTRSTRSATCARRDALAVQVLGEELRQEPAAEVQRVAGLPSARSAQRMLLAVDRALWRRHASRRP